jgi:hypothetical protein
MEKRLREKKANKSYDRKKPSRKERDKFLIYVQGAETKFNYFTDLKDNLNIKNLKIIVNSRIPTQMHDEAKKKKDEGYNEIWCVFDKDDFTDFNSAINEARDSKIGVAFSNECFELWYYLHFCYCDSSLGREVLFDKVKELFQHNFNVEYEKNLKNIYKNHLKEKTDIAIKYAKKLHKTNGSKSPSTTVYELIEKLREIKEMSNTP